MPIANSFNKFKYGWSKRIKSLENIIFECENIDIKRANAYVKVVGIVRDLNGLCITCDTGLISKDILMARLEKLKESKPLEFNSITDFTIE